MMMRCMVGFFGGMAPHNAGPPRHLLRQVGEDLGPRATGRETDGVDDGHGADPAAYHRAGVPGGGELTVLEGEECFLASSSAIYFVSRLRCYFCMTLRFTFFYV